MGKSSGWIPIVVRAAAMLTIVFGLGMLLLLIALGDCAAWGGHCPSEGVKGDVIGGAAFGAAMMGAGAVFAARPRLCALRIAAPIAAGAAVLAALIALSMTSW